MNYVNSLVEAIERMNYDETVRHIPKVFEDVLGYEKIKECNPDDETFIDVVNMTELNVNEMMPEIMKEAMKKMMSETPQLLNDQTTQSVIGIVIPIPGEARVKGHRCWHYANSSKIDPEGVITKVKYEVNPNNLKVRRLDSPPIQFHGYGERWWDRGEMSPVYECFEENLKIPRDILMINDMHLEEFIEGIKRRV